MPQGHSPVVPLSAQKCLTRPEERGVIRACGFASQRGSRGPELPPAGGAASLPHAARPAVLENDPMRTGHVLVGQPGPTQVTGAGQERPASRDTPGVTRAIGAGSEAAAPPGADPSLRPPPPRPSSLQRAHLVPDPGGDPEGLCHPDQTGSIAVARAGLHATVEVARPHPSHERGTRRVPVEGPCVTAAWPFRWAAPRGPRCHLGVQGKKALVTTGSWCRRGSEEQDPSFLTGTLRPGQVGSPSMATA